MENRRKLDNYIEDLKDNAVIDTLNKIEDVKETAREVYIDLLNEHATLTEVALAEHFIDEFLETFNVISNDVFEIIECDRCCDYCDKED